MAPFPQPCKRIEKEQYNARKEHDISSWIGQPSRTKIVTPFFYSSLHGRACLQLEGLLIHVVGAVGQNGVGVQRAALGLARPAPSIVVAAARDDGLADARLARNHPRVFAVFALHCDVRRLVLQGHM